MCSGLIFFFVCLFTLRGGVPRRRSGGVPHSRSGRGGTQGTPLLTRSGWGTPPDLGQGTPPDLGWGTPLPDLGWGTPPDLGWGTSPRPGMGYPPPQHSEHLIRGGRYAFCLHAEGLFFFFSALVVDSDLERLIVFFKQSIQTILL